MPFVLRGIKKKDKWDKDKIYADYSWLRPNGIPTWCFFDLADNESTLSLWHVENEHDPNLELICAAIASKRTSVQVFEYALFDTQAIAAANIMLSSTEGDTFDGHINQLHRDIDNLTAPILLQFLQAIWDHTKTGYLEKKEVKRIILERASKSKTDPKIDLTKINDKIRDELKI